MVKSITIRFIFLFLIMLPNTIKSQEFSTKSDLYPEISLQLTKVIPFYSEIMQEEYLLNICFPKYYDINKNEEYPIVYLLDGWAFSAGYHFIYHLLNIYEGLPDLITVGISYSGDFRTCMNKRQRDMIPLRDLFLNFFTEELIPYVDSSFKVKRKDRTLMGISTGGFWGFYVMLKEPNVFNKYILGGPGFIIDETTIFEMEEEYFENNPTLNAKIFTCEGALEDTRELKHFVSLLKSRNYKNLEIELRIFNEETHYTSIPFTFLEGLKYLFSE